MAKTAAPFTLNAAEWYHYYDSATAQKRGPYNGAQIENFYKSGVITDDTVIENQAGQTTEWKNLIQKPDDDDGNNAPFSFVGWLCDFRFKQNYVMKLLRLLVVIFYITEMASILLAGICMCGGTFFAAMAGLSNNQASALLLLLVLPLILVGTVLAIVLARLSCEYFLFFMDWLVTTKKAADKYNAE